MSSRGPQLRATGQNSVWITPSTLYARRFGADEHDAAADWVLGRMGLPH
ncbi:hypothetical protein [Nocardia macrotermitis]|nr:hypothetical protein [Nocardia macrotermitis]